MITLPPKLQQQWVKIREQVVGRLANELVQSDRAKALVGLVVVILFLSMTLGLASVADRTKRGYQTSELAYARLKAQVEGASWQERKAQSQSLKLALEERLWTATTPGLAEAGFERWLRDHLSRYKVEPQQIQVRRVPVATSSQSDPNARGPLSNMERVTAKIMMPFNQVGFLGFLDDIAESEKTVVVDRMIVRAGRNARIEMDVSTFYPLPDKR